MRTERIELGAYKVEEVRLRPGQRPDALIITSEDVTFQLQTVGLAANQVEALTDIVREGRFVGLFLEDYRDE